MPQNELIPSSWTVEASTESDDSPSIRLTSSSNGAPFNFSFEAVRPNVFRTTYTSESHPLPPHPSIPRPETKLGEKKASIQSTEKSKTISIGNVSATVNYSGETPHLAINFDGQEEPLLQDVPNRSYTVDGPGIAHYTRYNRGTLHVGLGEKAAPMNLSGRRFQLSATDSFGYDVHRTDPLYKNIPLLINATPKGCVATFSSTHARGEYSVGSEMDGMWGFYKVYRQDFGGLEEYVIVGNTLKDIVSTYASLAGYPLLVPRWAFGYLSGGMKYSMLDDPPASESLLELARKMKEHDIPCSAYQMSSGYTVAEREPKTRNVFTWNRHRFPDPEGWIKEYHKMGMRLIANKSMQVPPGLDKRPQIGLWGRSLHTELHGKASHDALLEVNPDERPFVLTRSATAGTMRYACSTWSGDNTTSWPGMKGANALSLNAGLSLLHCYGHDIGGFEGPQPSPELLLRWVQLGIYSPRFAINCFKTGTDNSVGDVIEPWMYPSITHLVRKTIKRRYALIPYIYSLALESHVSATPPQRWTGWGYESDPEVWTNSVLTDGETQYFLGDSLLIGGVYESGVSKARVYLPKRSEEDEGFLNLNAPYQYFAAGQWIDVDAEWHGSGIAVLGKVGGAIPVGRDVQVLSPGEKENVANLPLDDYRAVEILPPQHESKDGKWHETTWFEDNGVSVVTKNKISSYTIAYSAAANEIKVKFTRDESSGFEAPWQSLVVILPSGDQRTLVSSDGKDVKALGVDEQGRHKFELS
ncbi:neutral alpha-glucosidase ab [Verticillium alfalfae VaMs.102]|uniref:alpha-glucosidase n=1 Tax=Verticillium alfalfae (strain VaMs.102 / ATCC MYA-4576 / FGSC 10136) TaxID=526221 RepID=C9S5V7_VERA1|nr:neutral alpha-glucosidase ab [Verticillium alfalfae VaMs.102]EEY15096.1 neutral alpha-glucosidase ab [Verticillium alfalfae VaMs.102]